MNFLKFFEVWKKNVSESPHPHPPKQTPWRRPWLHDIYSQKVRRQDNI